MLNKAKIHIRDNKNRIVRRNPLMTICMDDRKKYYIQGGDVYQGENSDPLSLNKLPKAFWERVKLCTDDALHEVGFLRTAIERGLRDAKPEDGRNEDGSDSTHGEQSESEGDDPDVEESAEEVTDGGDEDGDAEQLTGDSEEESPEESPEEPAEEPKQS